MFGLDASQEGKESTDTRHIPSYPLPSFTYAGMSTPTSFQHPFSHGKCAFMTLQSFPNSSCFGLQTAFWRQQALLQVSPLSPDTKDASRIGEKCVLHVTDAASTTSLGSAYHPSLASMTRISVSCREIQRMPLWAPRNEEKSLKR